MRLSSKTDLVKGLLTSDPFIILDQEKWSRLAVVSAAYQLSLCLPDQPKVINLFHLRHEFLVVLMAVAFKQGVSILPANTAKNTLLNLVASFSEDETLASTSKQQVLIASSADLSSELIDYQLSNFDFKKALSTPVERLLLESALQSLADAKICLFTSGSTGEPKQVCKTWHQMMMLGLKAIRRFQLDDQLMVATIPSQHMFGLETTIFWPLFSKAMIWSEKPLFPEDFNAILVSYSDRIFLVSTPLHLKKWVASMPSWQSAQLSILSATAPMTMELAKTVSEVFNAPLYEVLGSTETASFASREILVSEHWALYDQNHLVKVDDGDYEVVFKDLNESHRLDDELEPLSNQTFKWLGRQTDMVKVAGKRTSLMEINRLLQSIDGVEDGVFRVTDSERLSAFVVSQLTPKEIKEVLKQSLDPVFLPRPIYFVSHIPRNEMGKLQLSALQSLVKS